MREIKFRAWDKKLKRYIEEAEGFHVIGECMMFGIIESYCNCNKADADTSIERLGDIEIQQFTGLHDKNGKEIYEGDIIKYQQAQFIWIYKIGRIETEGVNLFAINICDNVSIDDETDTYTYQMTNNRAGLSRPIQKDCEVIGNIYENPELLEINNG